jgi:hypothetical protein
MTIMMRSVCVLTGMAVLALGNSASAVVTDQQFAELAAKVQREADAREVENVMGRRANLYSANRPDLIIELFASKQPDTSFAMNGNVMLVGYDKVKGAFGPDPTRAQRSLEQLKKIYPQLDDKPENQGAGDFRLHALMSPVIEVAGDGKTAKGFWQTIGPAYQINNGDPYAMMSFEKYAVDFIKEDGQWKIWHLQVFIDSSIRFDKPFADQVKEKLNPAAIGPDGMSAGASPYQEWSPIRAPKQIELPKPYKTFSETFSYGPSATK